MQKPLLCVLVASLWLPPRVAAQATVTVPVQDPVYQTLDRLIGSGLIKVAISGQRPYTRREITRMLSEASEAAESRPVPDATRRQLERLRADYPADKRANGGATADAPAPRYGRWLAQVLALDSPPRAMPDDPDDSSRALINPILNDRAGRALQQGANAVFETEFDVTTRSLAIRARPRFLASAADPSAGARGDIVEASIATLWRNIRIELGRQDVVWGQGMSGGLIGSASARPMDMLRFSWEAPYVLPGFLRVLGPLRGSLYAADLGPHQNFPHAVVVAYKLSGQPFVRRFEMSAFVTGQRLGRGAPPATLWDHVADLIPVIKYTTDDNNAQFSNKFAGWEYRLRIPEVRGLQLYLEHAFDDMDPRRWHSTLWEDGGHIAGASVARLDADGALSGAVEYHHTGLRYYQHGVYTSGFTFNRTLIGDPLGNEADGGYVRLLHDAGGPHSLRVDFAAERRRGNTIAVVTTPPNEDDFHFVVTQAFPPEWRHRLGVTWRTRGGGRALSLEAIVERVRNASFVGGAHRTNILAGATLESLR